MLSSRNAFVSICTFFTLSAHAQFINLDIQDFNGRYLSPEGTGTAKMFDIPTPATNRAEIFLFKGNNNYQLQVDGHDYIWEDVPKMLLDIEQASWSKLALKSAEKNFSLSGNSLTLSSPSKNTNISGFQVGCSGKNKPHEDFAANLLESCLNAQGFVSVVRFSSHDKSKELTQELYSDLLVAINNGLDTNTASQKQEIEDVKLLIINQTFNRELETKVIFNTTVKVAGKIYYHHDENKIRLRLDKAKAGFLNIKSKIFEALEKNQDAQLQVNRPWVTYRIKD